MPFVQPAGDLREQGGLADARFAADLDHDETGRGCGVHAVQHGAQFGFPPPKFGSPGPGVERSVGDDGLPASFGGAAPESSMWVARLGKGRFPCAISHSQ
ncbi:hypothetical protein GCM10022267_47590 [Lentzea roselyniae]|uniref:Uncharacterized protein n=1 Tax=Lentzea roselyniae TaxID=531940 RepID=A0ABP7BES2_9PSEU